MMESVRVPRSVYEAIIAHAREGKPEEVCGIVRGVGLVAEEAIRATNVAQERIENYDIDTKTLLYFATHEDTMMGIYHSHPISEAYPSATDAWNAHYPDKIYFICSLEYDDAPVIRAFRMTAHFLDLDIPLLWGALDFYETRPGLFAYYQATGTAIPTVLAGLASEASLPFYVVLFDSKAAEAAPGGRSPQGASATGLTQRLNEDAEGLVVSLVEHPLITV